MLAPQEGLYFDLERAGAVDLLVSDAEIEARRTSPVNDTRAWGRAMLLNSVPAEDVLKVDWDHVRLRVKDNGGRTLIKTVNFKQFFGATQQKVGHLFEQTMTPAQLCDALNDTLNKSLNDTQSCPPTVVQETGGAADDMNQM